MVIESFLRRLSFVKYLYALAVEQSKKPEPLAAVSILMFHDSIELFFQIASEYLNVKTDKASFMDYFEILEKKIGKELAQKESMRRLNKSRVALKHHGTLPSKLDIEAMRASTTNFFNENTEIIFDFEFNDLSLAILVNCVEARENLELANKHIKEGKLNDSLVCIAIAFQQIIDNYETTKFSLYNNSPLFFGEPLTFESSYFIKPENQRLASFIDKVKSSVEAMQSAIKVMSLGLDYRKYAKFKILTPCVFRTASGRYTVEIDSRKENITVEDSKFCYDFVIESAIKIQDFEP